jgi:hypothetical protein
MNGAADWLTSGPFPDWITAEPDKRFGSLAEAWGEAEGVTRQVAPRMEVSQLQMLRATFFAGARAALEELPRNLSYDRFEARMTERRESFTRDCILPFLRPRTLPVFSPEAVRAETVAIIEHQHGYWLGGERAAILCRRAGMSCKALIDELDALSREIMARHRSGS